MTVTASVSDKAGNPASVDHNLTVDVTVPQVTISTIAGDDVINIAEHGQAQIISGIATGAAAGDKVTVTIGGQSYTTVLDAAGNWSVGVGINGSDFDDVITGNSGDNQFEGRGGNDTFNIGSGGHDTLLYKLLNASDATGGNGHDVVNGFTVGTWEGTADTDRIDLRDLLSDSGYTEEQALTKEWQEVCADLNISLNIQEDIAPWMNEQEQYERQLYQLRQRLTLQNQLNEQQAQERQYQQQLSATRQALENALLALSLHVPDVFTR
ncbi:Ig-like domain-containing protein [Enterobacter cloacae subsp. cloacae]|nr:Ig-like domain-containing protein [Enterobacter cloacae]WLD32098.1 Ig-like domain-containing protein [Enterobacter cloacae subsp. cloacae]